MSSAYQYNSASGYASGPSNGNSTWGVSVQNLSRDPSSGSSRIARWQPEGPGNDNYGANRNYNSGPQDQGWPAPKQHGDGWPGSSNQQTQSGQSQYSSYNGQNTQGRPNSGYSGPSSSSNQQQNMYDSRGRPLSPDGWPAKKTEIRGFTEPVPDFLTGISNPSSKSVIGKTSGWVHASSGNNSSGAASLPPTVASSVPERQPETAANLLDSWQSAARPQDQYSNSQSSIQAASTTSDWRTSTPRPTPTASSVPPQSHVSAPATGTNAIAAPPRTRSVSGWNVKEPSSQSDAFPAVPPVPPLPSAFTASGPVPLNDASEATPATQQSMSHRSDAITSPPAQPQSLMHDQIRGTPQAVAQTAAQNGSSSSTAPQQEAWILGSVDAVRNNNWTSTTRRSRATKQEQSLAYGIPLPSEDTNSNPQERTSSSFSLADENSIRPSESASNVGLNDSSSSIVTTPDDWNGMATAQPSAWKPPSREFRGEKDDDLGSNSSSGSSGLNDNPSATAGGWQRSPPRQAASTAQTTAPSTNGWAQTPQTSNHAGLAANRPQSSGQSLASNGAGHYGVPINAPVPRRSESASYALVGDLERAATPRGISNGAMAARHGRSVSTMTGMPSGGGLSIRGASKYHTESLQLREELNQIRAQVANYEVALANLTSGSPGHPASTLEEELKNIRLENASLRERTHKLEGEREQLRKALKTMVEILNPSQAVARNKHADELGSLMARQTTSALQDRTIIYKSDSPGRPQQAIGWN